MLKPILIKAIVLVSALLIWLPLAIAQEALDCFEAVQGGDTASAHDICTSLGTESPTDRLALGYYYIYGLIGTHRLQEYVMWGTPDLTSTEHANMEKGKSLVQSVAAAGNSDAQYIFGVVLLIHSPHWPEDQEDKRRAESEYWLRRSADSDHPEANHYLGVKAVDHYSPLGPTIRDSQYKPYLVRAAELGVPEAMQLLREVRATESKLNSTSQLSASEKRDLSYYQWGNSRTPPESASRLMREAAEEGDIKAMRAIARRAWPDEPNVTEKFLLMAERAGDHNATQALGDFHACMGNADKAKEYFLAAKENSHDLAQVSIEELDEWGTDEWDCNSIF